MRNLTAFPYLWNPSCLTNPSSTFSLTPPTAAEAAAVAAAAVAAAAVAAAAVAAAVGC